MAATLPVPAAARHVAKLDGLRPAMAKAVHKQDLTHWRAAIGHVITRVWALAGLSQKEAAALIGRDQAQVGRWERGEDRPQLDVMFAVPALRRPLIQALAELSDDVIVETVVRMRRDGR